METLRRNHQVDFVNDDEMVAWWGKKNNITTPLDLPPLLPTPLHHSNKIITNNLNDLPLIPNYQTHSSTWAKRWVLWGKKSFFHANDFIYTIAPWRWSILINPNGSLWIWLRLLTSEVLGATSIAHFVDFLLPLSPHTSTNNTSPHSTTPTHPKHPTPSLNPNKCKQMQKNANKQPNQ